VPDGTAAARSVGSRANGEAGADGIRTRPYTFLR